MKKPNVWPFVNKMDGINQRLDRLMALIDQSPGSKRPDLHPLILAIRAKGMGGLPVVCPCGEIYGDFWKYCIVCGQRKAGLPDDEAHYPLGHSPEPVVLRTGGEYAGS